ncbi:MAG: hypothetical protein LBH96_04325 [Candidatus Peribacteria bacterium]|jgi:hypothetical protein|nr:hypothetical protein [Candidatus Peribacteria bacterium]
MDFSQETDSAQEVLSPVSTDDFSLNFDDSVFASSPENKELDAVKDETPSSSLDFSLDLGSFSDTEPLVQEPELPVTESELQVAEPELPVTEPELQVAELELPVTESELPITESEFPIAEPELPVTESELPVAEQKLPIAESELSIAEPFLSPSMDDESSH